MTPPLTGALLHFSEDPGIETFVPHVAQTAEEPTPYVWAVDERRAPDYWFPRQCPRAMAWLATATTSADRERVLGPSASRVHMIEYAWLHRFRTARLFVYRFSAVGFEAHGNPSDPYAYVSRRSVDPLGPPEPAGDLLTLHQNEGIELRVVTSLWPWWELVTTTTVGFSGIRLGNASRPSNGGSATTPPR